MQKVHGTALNVNITIKDLTFQTIYTRELLRICNSFLTGGVSYEKVGIFTWRKPDSIPGFYLIIYIIESAQEMK